MNYSYRKFFQNLYITQGQQFRFAAQTEREYCLQNEAFPSALKETLSLNKLARMRQPTLFPRSKNNGGCYQFVEKWL